MTDLQLGLLVIGAIAVAGVLVYNRLQERATRRSADRAFASRHADVLLDEPAPRREPVLHSTAPSEAQHDAMPDSRVDYIIELAPERPVAAVSVWELWAPLERRFGKR